MLSQILVQAARRSPVSQTALAALIGVSGPTLSRWLLGDHVRRGDQRALLLARVLGVDEADVFAEVENNSRITTGCIQA